LQYHAVGRFFMGRDWEIVRIEAMMNGAKYRNP
jgi:hypothetical protein